MIFLVFYFILFVVLIFQGTHVAGEVKTPLGTLPEEALRFMLLQPCKRHIAMAVTARALKKVEVMGVLLNQCCATAGCASALRCDELWRIGFAGPG